MSVTGIVAALTAEARTLGPAPDHSGALHTFADGTLLVISGMGPAAATQAALALLAAGAGSLLSFGLAGALDPQLRAGAVLLPHGVTNGAGTVHPTCDPWRHRLAALGRPSVGGLLLSVAQPLSSVAQKSAAWRDTGAAAVDMESFAIAAVAAARSVDFAVARSVIDTAGDTLPHSVRQATDAHGEVAYGRLLAGLLRRPADVLALVRLAQRYRLAMQSLRYLGQPGCLREQGVS